MNSSAEWSNDVVMPTSELDSAESSVGASYDERFKNRVTEILGRFRHSVEQIVYSITPTLSNSRTLQTVLSVDLNLSWQIFKLLGPIETLSTISYVPAAVSMGKLTMAARKRGVSKDLLEQATSAFAAFEKIAEETARDRDEFETIVMSYVDSVESAQAGMHHRKAAFKSDVHYYGVAVDTLAFALFFHPGKTADSVDFVGLRQMLGLRRMAASTDVLIDRWRVSPETPLGVADALFSDAFDPEAAAIHGAAVIPEFCTPPLLPMVTRSDAMGNVRTLLKHRDIGVGQQVSITTGRIFREMPMDRTPDGRPLFAGLIEVARPTRVQVVDTFIHRPTWPNLLPKSGVFVHLSRRLPSTAHEDGVRLPFRESLVYAGSGSDAVRIAESPAYPDLVRHACTKMGWNFEDMDLYRLQIKYPLMDSNVLCRLECVNV
jgi:hypothetical protein